MTTIQERVQKGIEFLNEARPGWIDEIDLDRLYLGSPCNCILGQLFERYTYGLDQCKLAIYDGDNLGFDVPIEEEQTTIDYDSLTKAWRQAIIELRAGSR